MPPLTGLDAMMHPFLQRCRTYGAAEPTATLDAESAEVLENIKRSLSKAEGALL
mgnify:CR=1 FL=1